jgi:hypothetical protein
MNGSSRKQKIQQSTYKNHLRLTAVGFNPHLNEPEQLRVFCKATEKEMLWSSLSTTTNPYPRRLGEMTSLMPSGLQHCWGWAASPTTCTTPTARTAKGTGRVGLPEHIDVKSWVCIIDACARERYPSDPLRYCQIPARVRIYVMMVIGGHLEGGNRGQQQTCRIGTPLPLKDCCQYEDELTSSAPNGQSDALFYPVVCGALIGNYLASHEAMDRKQC